MKRFGCPVGAGCLAQVHALRQQGLFGAADHPGGVGLRHQAQLDAAGARGLAQLGGVANLEGLTFGPTLANGHRSLVVVADDNLPLADSLTDRNQFLVFEVMP